MNRFSCRCTGRRSSFFRLDLITRLLPMGLPFLFFFSFPSNTLEPLVLGKRSACSVSKKPEGGSRNLPGSPCAGTSSRDLLASTGTPETLKITSFHQKSIRATPLPLCIYIIKSSALSRACFSFARTEREFNEKPGRVVGRAGPCPVASNGDRKQTFVSARKTNDQEAFSDSAGCSSIQKRVEANSEANSGKFCYTFASMHIFKYWSFSLRSFKDEIFKILVVWNSSLLKFLNSKRRSFLWNINFTANALYILTKNTGVGGSAVSSVSYPYLPSKYRIFSGGNSGAVFFQHPAFSIPRVSRGYSVFPVCHRCQTDETQQRENNERAIRA